MLLSDYYVLARLFLDSGTEYLSDTDVTHPTRTYDGRCLNWGIIDRAIPVPAGIPQVSDSRIRINDSDRRWRDLSITTPLRRRFVDLKLVAHGGSESATQTIFRGEIVDYDFGPAYIELTIRNRAFAWMDEQIPALITEDNYGLGVTRAFLNIIQGHNVSTLTDEPGAIPCPHILFDSVAGDRFGLAAHPVEEVLAVWRKVPTKASSSDPDWLLVDPGEYTIGTEVDREFEEIPGIPFNPAYIDFTLQQEPGTVIRADVDGINYRGPWEGIPEANGFEVNRHPVNYFINMIYLIMHKAGTTADVWDVSSIEDLLGILENLIPDSSASTGFRRLNCDGAITEVLTVREWLGRYCQSTQIQVLEKITGKLAIAYIGDTDPSRPVFKEGYHILKESFHERAAQPTVNQTRYHYARQYGANKFEANKIFNNDADQLALGRPLIDTSSGEPQTDSDGDTIVEPQIEADDVDLWFVRDEIAALYIVGRRMNFLALGSLRQEWKMPLPEVLGQIELAKLVGITHAMGAGDIGGYTNKEVAITNLTVDLRTLMVTVRSVLRVPVPITPPARFTGCIPIDLLEGTIEPDDIETRWDTTQQLIPIADFDGIESSIFEVSFERDFDVDEHTFELVDETANVFESLTFEPAPPDTFNFRSRKAVEFDAAVVSRTYYFKQTATASPGCHLNQARCWFCVENSRRITMPIPLIFGAQDIGGFSGSEQANNRGMSAVEVWASTSYAQEVTFVNSYGIFKFERSKWGDIEKFRLTANAFNKAFNAGETGGVALYNRTDNVMVTGAELEWTAAHDDPTRKQVELATALLIDGKEYEVRSRSSSGVFARRLMINRVDLWPVLAGNTAPAQVYIKLASKASGGEPGSYRTKLEVYPAGTVFIYEVVAALVSGTAWVRLIDVGTSDDTEAGATVHEHAFTSTSKERKRATVTVTAGNRYVIDLQNVRFVSAFLIAEVPA